MDGRLFDRPTDIAWLPDGTFFISDGYGGTRVAKFDKDGQFLMDWGSKPKDPANPGPNEWNTVHSIAISKDGRLFVVDRGHHRFQVFDKDGKYLDEWSIGAAPADIHLVYMDGSRMLWAFDRNSSKMLKYDLQGHFLYSFGAWGNFPGGFWGVHGMHVDSEGNLYVAEVDNGGAQKFKPRAGANPAMLLTPGPKPVGGTQ